MEISMKKPLIIIMLIFLCFGCTNTKVEENPTDIVDNSTDIEEEPIEEVYDNPPYSTLDEYKHLDYFWSDHLIFKSYFDSSSFGDNDRLAIIINTDESSKGKSFYIGIYETDVILYYGDYEIVENYLFEGTLYSFSGSFNENISAEAFKGVIFPLQTDDLDGYFVLSDDFKTLYFLTDEEQLKTGDYSNAISCTMLVYD